MTYTIILYNRLYLPQVHTLFRVIQSLKTAKERRQCMGLVAYKQWDKHGGQLQLIILALLAPDTNVGHYAEKDEAKSDGENRQHTRVFLHFWQVNVTHNKDF